MRERKSLAGTGALLVASAAALFVAAPLAGASGTGVSRGIDSRPLAASEYVPGEVIVGFRPGVSRAAVARVHGRVPARVAQRFPGFRMELVKLSGGISVRDAIGRYRADPAVAFAEPNYLRHTDATIPNDALFDDLWALNNTGQSHPVTDFDGGGANPHVGIAGAGIHAAEAWDVEQGNGTVIGVIDNGVDVTHPDLENQLWVNPDEIPGNALDDDNNGHVDDVNGWDFGQNDDTLLGNFSGSEHGTHVAGTIAAELNDSGTGDGVVGVCPGCKIMVLKIADSSGNLSIAAEIAALAYAHSMGVKIVNMSLGGPEWLNSEREAIRLSGALAVVSAGNDSLDNDMFVGADITGDGQADVFSPSYPAAYSLANILTVGATNDRDENAYQTECFAKVLSKRLCAFTNWGHDSVDVSAPGVDIESSVPGGDYETHDGTSMSAPHVSGIAGLVLSNSNNAFTVSQVKNAIMHSVDKPLSLRTMYISTIGQFGMAKTGVFSRTAGRVNANTAVTTASTLNATPLNDGNVNGAITMSRATVSGTVAWPADINDVKKRRLLAGHTYRITLVVPTGKDYDLYVWKPGTKEIWQPGKLRAVSARGGSVDEVVRFRALTTGTYYLHVSAWFFKSGKYTLSIRRLS